MGSQSEISPTLIAAAALVRWAVDLRGPRVRGWPTPAPEARGKAVRAKVREEDTLQRPLTQSAAPAAPSPARQGGYQPLAHLAVHPRPSGTLGTRRSLPTACVAHMRDLGCSQQRRSGAAPTAHRTPPTAHAAEHPHPRSRPHPRSCPHPRSRPPLRTQPPTARAPRVGGLGCGRSQQRRAHPPPHPRGCQLSLQALPSWATAAAAAAAAAAMAGHEADAASCVAHPVALLVRVRHLLERPLVPLIGALCPAPWCGGGLWGGVGMWTRTRDAKPRCACMRVHVSCTW